MKTFLIVVASFFLSSYSCLSQPQWKFHIAFEDDITIYDVIGNEVYSSKENKQSVSVDLSSYSKGIYFLKANEASKMYNRKIILH